MYASRYHRGGSLRHGITLIELLVTLAVLAILATLAAPSFQNTLREGRVSSQANALAALINYGRSEATQATAIIAFRLEATADGWTGCIINANPTACPSPLNCQVDDACILRQATYRNVLATVLDGNSSIDFDPRGIVTTAAPTIRLTHTPCNRDRQSRDVTVLVSGQTLISSGQCGG